MFGHFLASDVAHATHLVVFNNIKENFTIPSVSSLRQDKHLRIILLPPVSQINLNCKPCGCGQSSEFPDTKQAYYFSKARKRDKVAFH